MDLNQPVGFDEPTPDSAWSPVIGLRRAATQGLAVALVISALLIPLCLFVTPIVMGGPRGVITLFSAWLLFAVTQRAAGMVGWAVTALAIALTLLVLFSTHVVVALHGMPTTKGVLYGWVLLSPTFLFFSNLSCFVYLLFVAVLCHRGATLERFLGMLNQRHYGP